MKRKMRPGSRMCFWQKLEVFASLPGADLEEDKAKNIDPFKVAIEKLDEYFSPKQHEAFERNSFWNL